MPSPRLCSPSAVAFLSLVNLRALQPFEKSPENALSFSSFTHWVLPSGPSELIQAVTVEEPPVGGLTGVSMSAAALLKNS